MTIKFVVHKIISAYHQNITYFMHAEKPWNCVQHNLAEFDYKSIMKLVLNCTQVHFEPEFEKQVYSACKMSAWFAIENKKRNCKRYTLPSRLTKITCGRVEAPETAKCVQYAKIFPVCCPCTLKAEIITVRETYLMDMIHIPKYKSAVTTGELHVWHEMRLLKSWNGAVQGVH